MSTQHHAGLWTSADGDVRHFLHQNGDFEEIRYGLPGRRGRYVVVGERIVFTGAFEPFDAIMMPDAIRSEGVSLYRLPSESNLLGDG
jgi:hypothetical protein